MKDKGYVRILVKDALSALRALGECKVVAAGLMYVTFWFDDCESDCKRLNDANISWSYDQ